MMTSNKNGCFLLIPIKSVENPTGVVACTTTLAFLLRASTDKPFRLKENIIIPFARILCYCSIQYMVHMINYLGIL